MRSQEFIYSIKESCIGQASPIGTMPKKKAKIAQKEKIEKIAKDLKKVK